MLRDDPVFCNLSVSFLEADQAILNSNLFDFYQTEKNRGRHEIRSHCTTSTFDIPQSSQWKGLRTIGIVVSKKVNAGRNTLECRYYISSIENNVKLYAKEGRSHWGIENSLHWVRDVTFLEDECRIRKGDGPENFAVLRHIARNLPRQEKTKMNIKQKQPRAGWDEKFLGNIVFC